MVIVVTLHVINAGVCGGIQPFRNEVVGTSASLPVPAVTLIESEYNQKGRSCDQDTDSVRMKDIGFQFPIHNVKLHVGVIEKKERNGNQSGKNASINCRPVEFEDQIPSKSGTIVGNHCAYCAEDVGFLLLDWFT